PEPTEVQVERLRRRWFLLRRGRQSRGAAPWAVAAIAAGLLVAAGAAGWRWLGEPSLRLAPDRKASQAPTNRLASVPRSDGQALSRPESERRRVDLPMAGAASLALTSYEQVAAMAVLRRREEMKPVSNIAASASLDEKPLEWALAALTEEAESELIESEDSKKPAPSLAWRASAAKSAASLAPQAERYEPALWAILRDRRAAMRPRRLAAARLLSQLATPHSAFVLERLARVAEFHAAAIVGLARVVGVDRRVELIAAERQSDLQRVLLASLLERGDASAVERFLGYVDHPAWRRLALAAAQDATQPPVDMLFALLTDPRISLREAAAMTLGNVADPTVPARLARHVAENVSRREALLGLLTSPSQQSAGFVRQAKQDLQLMATVQSVEYELFSTDFPRR
ncbi:MAG TPA: hypothetical protein VHB99_02865, partial [Pirellulales bacterium]|nr:hypothetical protein [Pirellulales bacterium]